MFKVKPWNSYVRYQSSYCNCTQKRTDRSVRAKVSVILSLNCQGHLEKSELIKKREALPLNSRHQIRLKYLGLARYKLASYNGTRISEHILPVGARQTSDPACQDGLTDISWRAYPNAGRHEGEKGRKGEKRGE